MIHLDLQIKRRCDWRISATYYICCWGEILKIKYIILGRPDWALASKRCVLLEEFIRYLWCVTVFLIFNFNLFSSVFFYKKKHCLAQLWPGMWCHCILGWHLFSAGMRECDNQPCRLTRRDMQAPLPPPELWQTPISFCFWVVLLEAIRHLGSKHSHLKTLRLILQPPSAIPPKPTPLLPVIKQQSQSSKQERNGFPALRGRPKK